MSANLTTIESQSRRPSFTLTRTSLLRFLPPSIGIVLTVERALSLLLLSISFFSSLHFLLRWGRGCRVSSLLNFIVHLRAHTPHGNDLDGPNTSPASLRTGPTSPSGTLSFSATLLGSFGFRRTASNQTTGTTDAHAQCAQLRGQLGKESDTRIDSYFGRIFSQTILFLDHATVDSKGTTRRANSRQTRNFQT
jgi:hypothetical protein